MGISKCFSVTMATFPWLLLAALVTVAAAGRRHPRFFLPAINIEKKIHFDPNPYSRWWAGPTGPDRNSGATANASARCWFMTCSVVKSDNGDDVIVMNEVGHVVPAGAGKHHSRRFGSVLWKPCCLWPFNKPTTGTSTVPTVTTTSGGDDETTDSIVFTDDVV